jgi:hypothetical protein
MAETTGIIVLITGVSLLMVLSFLSPLMTDMDKFIGLLFPILVIIAGGCLLFVNGKKKPSKVKQDLGNKAYADSYGKDTRLTKAD